MAVGRNFSLCSTRLCLCFQEQSSKCFYSTHIHQVDNLYFFYIQFKSFVCSGKPVLGQLVDSNYLLDFDIFHVSAVTELLHYIDPKYLSSDLGGSNGCQVEAWINTQYLVDKFTVR